VQLDFADSLCIGIGYANLAVQRPAGAAGSARARPVAGED
jgi:hypothetical protein